MKTFPIGVLLLSAMVGRSLFGASPAPSPAQEPAERAARYEAVSTPQFVQGKRLVSLLGIRRGDSVLDLGCGTGRLAEYVARTVGPAGKVVGIDPSPQRIAIAQRRRREGLSFAVGGSDDLSSFPDASFDRVYLNYVFHWIENKAETLRQIHRILKPGGRLGISTGYRDRPSRIRSLIRESVREALGEVPPDLFLSPFRLSARDLRSLAERAGFRVVRLQILSFRAYAKDPEAVIAFLDASSSGRFLSGVGEQERSRILAVLRRKLAKIRTARGIEMEHPAIFLVAEKPR
ncbi:class I SAM-dependent methyltransferase [Methylacidimicrobium sp. AP8]|uniref:class I SAM-dependent methyltransferase n=1 Tax=Methylacidimicrobium sp. AP8 TaxID=2730359 RepID=UPI001923EB02|nr:methyltransferase domain-containing protein [Methylacidimicrobium sp. AP8]